MSNKKKKIKTGTNSLRIANGGIHLIVEFIKFEKFKKPINRPIITCNMHKLD